MKLQNHRDPDPVRGAGAAGAELADPALPPAPGPERGAPERGHRALGCQGQQDREPPGQPGRPSPPGLRRRTVPLWVGPTEKAYAPEDGSVYHVTVAGEKNGKYDELCNVTVDGKGFIHANSSRYHLVGDSWRDAVEAVFQMGEALEMVEGSL